MKIFAVTNNHLQLSDDISSASFCKVFHLRNWHITQEEYVENLFIQYELPQFHKIEVSDNEENIVMVKCNPLKSSFLNKPGYRIIESKLDLITNAVHHFLEECKRSESNYCCNP